MAKKQSTSKPKQPKHDKPHSGVDRRRKDIAGRKYSGTVMTKY